MRVLNDQPDNRKAQLFLEQLRFSAYIGWTPEERASAQFLYVSVQLELRGVPNACRTDNLEETICYGQVVSGIEEVISGKKFRLLEHVAGHVEEAVLQFRPLLNGYEIIVEKQYVPIKTPYEAVRFSLAGRFDAN